MTEHHLPQERDLPAGRLAQLKDDLMTQIEHDLETEPRVAPVVTHRRWRRAGLVAAVAVAVLGLATALVLGTGDDSASANTVERTDDGEILITIREARNPEDLQRRLVDLGVPAVVDFLDSGFRCDPDRSTGWVQPRAEELFSGGPVPGDGETALVLHPDQLRPGETLVLEFQIHEHDGTIAASVVTALSTTAVGPCNPVPDDSVGDAEEGIADS